MTEGDEGFLIPAPFTVAAIIRQYRQAFENHRDSLLAGLWLVVGEQDDVDFITRFKLKKVISKRIDKSQSFKTLMCHTSLCFRFTCEMRAIA